MVCAFGYCNPHVSVSLCAFICFRSGQAGIKQTNPTVTVNIVKHLAKAIFEDLQVSLPASIPLQTW